MQVTKRENKALEMEEGRFQAGMRAPGTTGENCTEVTRRLGWEIWISSDCLWDLARLEGRQREDMCNF